MKEKMNQLFKDKLLLVMLVLGLLTIVAAAGAVRVQRGSQSGEANPYLDMEEPQGIIAQGDGAQNQFGGQSAEIAGETPIAGDSNALADAGDGAAEENQIASAQDEPPVAQVGADQAAATISGPTPAGSPSVRTRGATAGVI